MKKILLLSLGTASSLSLLQAAERPNIMWIFTEDLSPLMGCYGDPCANTPFLDELAEKSVVYTNVYTIASISGPSRSGLVTGMYPNSLGTPHQRQAQTIPEWFRCFPEYLNEAGYHTSLRNKTDFNFSPEGIFTESSDGKELWNKRKKRQSFFVYRNTGATHEARGNVLNNYKKSIKHLPEERLCDPEKVILPPYFPNTPEMRRLCAGYYDLAATYDTDVEAVFKQLEEDGLLDNTIVFVFSDHGTGLPRYKRWLNITGINIPLIVYAPEKYQHLLKNKPGEINHDIISSIDFGPTALNLAGVKIPEHMQGQPFLGENLPKNREYAFAARDRADDTCELSRAIISDRYIYVRHFMPYLPYIQSGDGFGSRKDGYRELRRVYGEDTNSVGHEMWERKPVEELYDLALDPQETNNVAGHPAYAAIKETLKKELRNHLIETRDASMLPEPEMMLRSVGQTTYEMALNPSYDIEALVTAAEKVGMATLDDFITGLKHADSGVRYWSIIGIRNLEKKGQIALPHLLPLLEDVSPSCQVAAAEVVARLGLVEMALPVLQHWLEDDALWNKLFAARALEQIAPLSIPLNEVMIAQMKALTRTVTANGTRKYKDGNLSSSTGWMLEGALRKNESGKDCN